MRASFVYLRPSINGIQPIPLELLLVTTPQEEPGGTMRVQQRKNQTLVRKSSFDKGRTMPSVVSAVAIKGDSKTQHSINFIHLGRKYYNLVLWASTPMSQRKWYEIIWKQQQAMRDRSLIFDTINLSEGFFSARIRSIARHRIVGVFIRVNHGFTDWVHLFNYLFVCI